MDLFSVVVASHDQWREFTAPLLASLRKHEPRARLVIVDSGSKPPYPNSVDDFTTIIRTDNESHCKAINLGLVHCPISEWYLILDNDVLITHPIGPVLKDLKHDAVYGAEVRHWRFGDYAIGWCFAIPREVLLSVGLYDENYIKILFEETDYCYRAVKRGFDIRCAEIPAIHVNGGGGSRKFVNSDELTEINRTYFVNKHRLEWVE